MPNTKTYLLPLPSNLKSSGDDMDLPEISNSSWDYIFVGGGLSASVVSHRLHEFNNQLKILVVEAGPDANSRTDIVWPNSTNSIGGDFD